MRILIAEDSRYQNRILQVLLESWGHTVLSTTSGTAALEVLSGSNPPELALLDWEMPVKTGLEVCAELRGRGGKYVYTILLTAKDSHADIAEGLTGGADDFISKPPNPLELWARIYVGQRALAMHRELVEARERLEFEATHDALTGLWNRRAIMSFFEGELSRSKRQASSVAALVIDIDDFKAINDTYGHSMGDRVLEEVAKKMNGAMRPYDFLGRSGGEEFLVILPGADLDGAYEAGERIRLQVKEIAFADQPSIKVSISVGAAVHQLDQRVSDVIEAADSALYRAKLAGKDRVELMVPFAGLVNHPGYSKQMMRSLQSA